ncbi:MAG: hypothetical protein ACXQS7_05505 [Candidatus Syntropharchaeia archaeon]
MVKVKIKKKEEGGDESPAAAPTPTTPTMMPPKITLKGARIHIDEIVLSKKKK